MNNTLKTIVWIAAGIAIISLGIATVLFFAGGMRVFWEPGNGIGVDEKKSAAIGRIEQINVQTSSTDVYVTSGEGDSVDVRLHGTVYTGEADAVPTLSVEQTGDVLDIALERRDGRKWVLGFYSSDLILEIRVPRQFRDALVVNSSSGNVEINDLALTELSIETSSGEIRVSSIRATSVVMETTSGDQTAEGLDAERATMISSSGEIRVTDLRGGASAESSSGDISLRYSGFNADLEVRSSSGDVTLHLTDSAQFQVEARVSSGDTDCAFPVTLGGTDSQISRNRLFATVGEGTHQVMVRTSSGDITIRP